ncbi:response regulator [Roseivirga echinicomitans]
MKTKVLLVDDHAIVIEGLRAVLGRHEEIEICAEASNGEEALSILKNQNDINVVVLDINMPIMDGLTCAKRIKSTYPEIKIVILTMYAQKSFIEEMIKIGIDGSLLKSNTGKELKEAILRVNSGKSYYDLIQTFNEDNDQTDQCKLGNREVEIIKLLAEGFTSSQIAEKLFISENTVKTHRKNILKKTDLHNTSELIQFALNNQIM